MASSSPAAGMSPGFTKSLRTSLREMDVEYLEQRARIWIESCLNETFPASEKLGSILADGEVLLRLSKVLEAGGQSSDAFMKAPSTTRMASRKGYLSYSNADTFIKFCRDYGVLDLDLFTPVDLVEGKDLRRVCLTLRALAKKAHARTPAAFPDFDDSAKRPGSKSSGDSGASVGRIGGILDHFEGRPSAAAAGTGTGGNGSGNNNSNNNLEELAAGENEAPGMAEVPSDAGGSNGRPLSARSVMAEVAPGVSNAQGGVKSPVRAKAGVVASPVRDRVPSSSAAVSSPPPIVPSRNVAESVAQRQRQLLESVTGVSYSSAEPPTRDIPVVAESQVGLGKQQQQQPLKKASAPSRVISRSSSSSAEGGGGAGKKKGAQQGAGEKGGYAGGRSPLVLVVGGAAAVLTAAAVALVVGKGGRRRTTGSEEEHDHMYSVKKGDTLASISKRVGKKDWEEIVRLNPNIRNPNLIYPAEVLKL